jgi:hypothetical protein
VAESRVIAPKDMTIYVVHRLYETYISNSLKTWAALDDMISLVSMAQAKDKDTVVWRGESFAATFCHQIPDTVAALIA